MHWDDSVLAAQLHNIIISVLTRFTSLHQQMKVYKQMYWLLNVYHTISSPVKLSKTCLTALYVAGVNF